LIDTSSIDYPGGNNTYLKRTSQTERNTFAGGVGKKVSTEMKVYPAGADVMKEQ
jgi:hypothetical protein